MKKRNVQVCYALILLNAVALSGASLGFQVPSSVYTGGTFAVLTGDFNGDGKLDLMVQSPDGPAQVFLSNGNGTFRLVKGTNPGVSPTGAVVADFNGDGKLDVAVATESPETIEVLLGEGNGKLRSTPIVTAVGSAGGMAAGDVNGDGIVDLVIGSFPVDGTTPPFQVLLGKGNGTFQAAKTIASSLAGGAEPKLVDVNHDGILDLVYLYGSGASEIVTQLGNGDGTFGDPLIFKLNGNSQAFAIADVNGDGVPDVVAGCYVNSLDSICVGLGNGDGTFSSAGSTAVPVLVYDLALGDFNNDGNMDVVVIGNQEGGVSPSTMTVLLGKGDGSFPSQSSFFWDDGGMIAVGDFNGDGFPDLAVANVQGNSVDVTLGDGHGGFVAMSSPNAGTSLAHGVAAADLNGDGKMDLAVVDGGEYSRAGVHAVDILIANGDGTYQPPVTVNVGVSPTDVAIAALNGDGILDLVVSDAGSPAGVWVLLGQTGGTYKAPVYYASPVLTGIALKDVNGDGVPDLIGLAENNDKVVVWLGKGDGTFLPGHGFGAGSEPEYMTTGDFNGDGQLDIAVSNHRGNTVVFLPGNGDGTFGSPVTVASIKQPSGIVAGDFNGDGIADLAVASEGLNTVQVYLGNGNGTFQAPNSIGVGGGVLTLVAADFNGDGNLDLAVAGRFGYQITVLLGNGAGQLQLGGVYDAGGEPANLIAADLNGDGRPDFAIVDITDGTPGYLSIMLNNSN